MDTRSERHLLRWIEDVQITGAVGAPSPAFLDKEADAVLPTAHAETVSQLVTILIHELNNILEIIIGHSEIASERVAMDSPLNQNLNQIRKAAARAATLVKQLRALSL